jgi:hypothetical protein
MNDPMPPETSSSFPEDDYRDESAPAMVEASTRDRDNALSASATDRRRYDDLIAVVVALLGIGSILWFTLGKSNPLTAKFPFQLPDAGIGGTPANPSNANLGSSTAQSPSAQPSGAVQGNQPGVGVSKPSAEGNSGNLIDPAVGTGAAIGAAAGVANNATAQAPTAQPDGNKVATAPSPASKDALPVPPSPPAGSVQTDPSKVGGEADVLPSPTKPRLFSDVPETAAIAPYLAALSSRGLMDGFDGNTFQPNKPITRAEFAGILRKAFEKKRVKPEISFSDVKSDYAGKAAVTEATQTGFMNGFPDKTFKPDLQIPRYQMQVALVTGLGLSPSGDPVQALSKYSDAKSLPKWAVPKVSAAVQSGIISLSKDGTTLDPNQPATRGDAAVMIHEALVKEGKLPVIGP